MCIEINTCPFFSKFLQDSLLLVKDQIDVDIYKKVILE